MKDRLGFRFVLCSAVFMILTQHRALADFDSDSHGYTITNDHKLYLGIILQEEKTCHILRLFFFSWGRVNAESVEEEWEMVQKKGLQFTLNGQPFYVNGFNTYWMMTLAADNSTRGKVTDVFQQASAVGLTVGRTWAFNDGQWRALQKSPSVYDEEVFKVYRSINTYKSLLLFFFLFKGLSN